MSFNSMPNDLLLDITQWVGFGYEHEEVPDVIIPDSRSLCRLALCSRRLNAISTPILYRNFSQVSYLANSPGFGIFSFLKTILAKPELGHFVKSYIGATSGAIFSKLNHEKDSWTADDATRALNAIERFGTPVGNNWWRTDWKGNWDALTALTLSLLPNLHELVLLFSHPHDNSLLEDMMNQLVRGAPLSFLSQLRCIILKPIGTRTTNTLDVATASPYFRIPSTKTLTLYGLQSKLGHSRSRSLLPKHHCDYSQLRLLGCNIHGDALVELLADFTSLTEIEYRHDTNWRINLLPHKVGKAIAHLKPCLKHLKVSSMKLQPIHGREAPRLLGSLAGFTQLLTLESSAYILVGPLPEYKGSGLVSSKEPEPRLSDILPNSLSHLGLLECGADILRNVQGVIEQKRLSFPFLLSIYLEYHDLSQSDKGFETDPLPLYRHYDEEAADRLKEECAAVGLSLR